MNTALLDSIGLKGMDLSYIFIGLAVLIILLIILIVMQNRKIGKLIKKYEKFMVGKNAKSLENEIMNLSEDNNYIRDQIDSNNDQIKSITARLMNAFQKCGIVKYDAFDQMVGQLSYAIALLDQKDNGFIINSVHSTDGSYTYAKEIKNGNCDISLGKEEEEALNKATAKN